MRRFLILGLLICPFLFTGCTSDSNKSTVDSTNSSESSKAPVFTLSWSEYASWSTFGVAEMNGLIDGEEGSLGTIEEKHNVDIVLKLSDYDTCILQLGQGTVDASCVTNLDALAAATSNKLTAILPTSTSNGADALLVTEDVDEISDLKGVDVYGLEKTVSELVFKIGLENLGENPDDYSFKNMDPAAAAQAMQQKQKNISAIVVWNPFVLQTERSVPGVKRLFDSSKIPGIVVDMVVANTASLEKEGGDRFAQAVCESFYTVVNMMENKDTRNDTLVSLGSKFSSLGAEDMAIVCEETKFYKTPLEAKSLFGSLEFRDKTMPKVAEFAKENDIVDEIPNYGFNKMNSQLNFTDQFLN